MASKVKIKCIHIVYGLYSIGPGSSSGKTLGQGRGRPGFDPGCRRGGNFSSLRVQIGPGVHSISSKMSSGSKGSRAQDQCRGCVYEDPCIDVPRGTSRPLMGIPLSSPLYSICIRVVHISVYQIKERSEVVCQVLSSLIQWPYGNSFDWTHRHKNAANTTTKYLIPQIAPKLSQP